MTRPLWTLSEIVAATGGSLDLPLQKTGGPEGVPPAERKAGLARAEGATPVTGISIDTRTLEPGDLFVPLTDARDGHDFVTAAFARGAVAALVRASYARKPGDGVLVRVPDTEKDSVLAALEAIGRAARARLSPAARVIAVTGSAGKTGTKEMLRACLRTCASAPDKVHAPEKSFNNHWGVPLTLARMPADTEFAVFEIGMNHAGEIRPLTKMVRPHIAIVTNVLPVHVGNFPDGEIGVANAKAEIFEGLEAPPAPSPGGAPDREVRLAAPGASPPSSSVATGDDPGSALRLSPSLRPGTQGGEGGRGLTNAVAVILRDSPHYDLLRAAAARSGACVRSFGLNHLSDVRLANLSGALGDLQDHQHVVAEIGGKRFGYDLAMAGQHLAINSLGVMAALDALGLDVARASRALADVAAAAGRGARLLLGSSVLLLDESYNANPASMAAALANLAGVDPDGRRIAVLGDMLELGPQSPDYHKSLLPHASRADLVFCCGPNMRHLYDLLPPGKRGVWGPTSADLVAPVIAALRPGDAVMVKGSLGSRMAPIVDAIKKHFADASKGG